MPGHIVDDLPGLALRSPKPLSDFVGRRWVRPLMFGVEAAVAEASLMAAAGTVDPAGQYLSVAALGPHMLSVLILPVIHLMAGLIPGYVMGPIKQLRRRVLAAGTVILVTLALGVMLDGSGRTVLTLVLAFLTCVVLSPIAAIIVRRRLIRAGLWGMPVTIPRHQHADLGRDPPAPAHAVAGPRAYAGDRRRARPAGDRGSLPPRPQLTSDACNLHGDRPRP